MSALTASHGGADDNDAQANHLVTHSLTAEGSDASEDGTGRGTPLVPWSLAVAGDFSAGEDVAQTVRAAHGQPGVVGFAWQAGGDGTASGAFEDELSPTLQRQQTMAVGDATAVRRLTPVECERLQGLPDEWTATSNGKPQADSPRYKQLGNCLAVPVFEWVARRLVAVDEASA